MRLGAGSRDRPSRICGPILVATRWSHHAGKRHANLDFAVITGESVAGLDESWNAPGTYILMDPVDAEG